MSVLSRNPRCGTKIVTVGDALDKLRAFSAIYESGKAGSVNNCDLDDNQKAYWRNQVYDAVINCGGEPTEFDFFEKVYGGTKTKRLEATDLYIDYRCDKDYNIMAAGAVQGNTPGGAATFQLIRANHSADGKYSNASVGGQIYIYEDRRWVRVTAVTKTTNFAHTVTVQPLDGDYTVNIRAGKKMMFNPTRFVDGLSCSAPVSTWETPGYVKKVSPIDLRLSWEQPMDLSAGYQDILQFAIMFDDNGQQVDGWIPYSRMDCARNFKFAKNMYWMMGERVTNSAFIGTGLVLNNGKYSGFDGYLTTMRFGGGNVREYDPVVGINLEADFLPVIKRQDSLKKCKNFLIEHGLDFMEALVRNMGNIFKDSAGQINLNVFKQLGANMDIVQKLELQHYSFLGFNFEFNRMSALTDSRSIGNYDMPYLGMMMPLDMQKDSKGNSVPAIEFFEPYGTGEVGPYTEIGPIDHRYLTDMCNKWSGYIEEKVMATTHCPQNHYLFSGVVPCA